MSILTRSESRDGYAVRVLAVHTTEGGGTAQALRDAAWWTGSSHAIADKRGTLLTPAEGCVPYDRASWTLRSGNRWSENIELVGYAASTRAQWLADDAELDACARWLADRSKARGIPLVKITAAQYRAGGRGVIGHVDHTEGYQDGTHWDPGPNFPYDVVLAKARAYASGKPPEEDFMATLSDAEKTALMDVVTALRPGMAGRNPAGPGWLALINTNTAVSKLAASSDPAAFMDALRPMLLDAVKAGMEASGGVTPEEVADELAARLGASQ